MALPNQPDVAYQFVRTLLDCGYEGCWSRNTPWSNQAAAASSARICRTA
jgi:hypothetical protein